MGLASPGLCDYRCVYCIYGSGEKMSSEGLTGAEVQYVLSQAKSLGAKTIEIAGKGEPTLWPGFRPMVSQANSLGLTVVLFTNGRCLSHDHDFFKFLLDNDVSVILKFNSFNDAVQNFLCGNKRAARYRDAALDHAFALGFNKGVNTRLGFETVICRQNIDEIPVLWEFARQNNIFPFFEALHLGGRALNNRDISVNLDDLFSLFKSIAALNKAKYGYVWLPKLPYLGFSCTVSEHIVINEDGSVSPCFEFPGTGGNIRTNTLIDILRDSELIYHIRKTREQANKDITCRDI
ncbi:MAG: radical SAM protein [Candidatus Bilamarchaeaceae archaeon]